MAETTGGDTPPSPMLRVDKTMDERIRQLEVAVFGSPDLRVMGLIDLLPRLRSEVEALKQEFEKRFDTVDEKFREVLAAVGKLQDTKLFWLQFIATLGAVIAAVIAAVK